jgi:hypothetical protein
LGWLDMAGKTIFVGIGIGYVYVIPIYVLATRRLEEVDAQLLELRYRWLANGGLQDALDSLKAMYKPDTGIDYGTTQYREWWGTSTLTCARGQCS